MKPFYLLFGFTSFCLFPSISLFAKTNLDKTSTNAETCLMCDPVSDSLALVALYNATNGANWIHNWNLEEPMDSWHGVIVNQNGCVTCLDLDGTANCGFLGIGNNLVGTLPSELGDLEALEYLSLHDNQLSGTIPASLGQLTNLTDILLYENQLTGAIPSELGQLNNLKTLQLYDNQLSGSIPTEIGQLSNLEELDLSRNQLSGSIPFELQQLTNLESLGLSENELTGTIPIELGQLANLQVLDLSRNELTGNIPIELGQLSNLELLIFSENQLTGSIPAILGGLSHLRQLFLHHNQLSGSIPIELSDLSDLQDLYLNANQLTGNIPIELRHLSNLRYLYLNHNLLEGNIPPELSQLTNLKRLILHSNLLTGNIPPELGQLSNLEDLVLAENQLTGPIPSELGQLSNLTDLVLYTNELSGSIPVELAQLNNLTYLLLYRNDLSGCFPTQLGVFCNITYSFWGNSNLPGAGDFPIFCNDQTGACPNNSIQVWPGDTNADGIVNYHDVLTLNLKQGKTGPSRPNANTTWSAQSAPDWNDTQPDGKDTKHADCNGDGLVDNNTDAPIVSAHYGNTHGNGTSSFLSNFTGDALLRPAFSPPNSNPSTIQLSLQLEELIGANIEFYGIGFTLDYSEVSTDVTMNVDNSDMGQEGIDLYAFSQDVGVGEMDIVLTRTDGNTTTTTTTNNELCELSFLLDNASTATELHLRFHNIKIVDANGEEVLPMLGSSATISFSPGSGLVAPLSVLVNADFVEDCVNGAMATAIPSGGTGPYEFLWSNGSSESEVSNLSVGMHQVTVTDATNNMIISNIEVFGGCAVLPLEWIAFQAIPQTNSITLEWIVNQDENIQEFEIQRSTDGIFFTNIATISSKSGRGQINYQWIDDNVRLNTIYYYKIQSREADNRMISSIQSAQLSTAGRNVISIYPNPIQNEARLVIHEASNLPIKIAIYNQLGQRLYEANYPITSDRTQIFLNFEAFDSGLYFIEVLQNNQTHILKTIKQ